MFPSDLFPQLVNFAEQLFLVPGQGFGYVYFALGSDTKIGEVTSFLVSKLPSVRIDAIPHIPSWKKGVGCINQREKSIFKETQ